MGTLAFPEHLLLHTCCAPCLIAPYHQLKEQGLSFTSFWYNPNVHLVTEYRMRLQTLKTFAEKEDIPLILHDDYGLRNFVKAVVDDIDDRCRHCFRTRLEMTAQTALELGYDAFSTTLLYSIYQKHDLIKEIGEEIAERNISLFSIEIGELYGQKEFAFPKKQNFTAKNIVVVSLAKRTVI